jgi:hypothetical protein
MSPTYAPLFCRKSTVTPSDGDGMKQGMKQALEAEAPRDRIRNHTFYATVAVKPWGFNFQRMIYE